MLGGLLERRVARKTQTEEELSRAKHEHRFMLVLDQTVGNPDCPIMRRWILALPWVSLRLHKFFAGKEDYVAHNHPWWFVTFVLQGTYEDLVPCERCGGEGKILEVCGVNVAHAWSGLVDRRPMPCPAECLNGYVVGDVMKPGTIRFRPANHRHRTKVGPEGCTTIILTGRFNIDWGFFTRGGFMRFDAYRKSKWARAACEPQG